jgi:ankyrin repeat protein
VTVRIKSDFRSLSIAAEMAPLHLAATFCAQNHTEIVTTLLEHGTDPNATHDKAGLPPLFCAAVTHNLSGLNALVVCAGERLQIEKGSGVVSDTALGGAVYAGTTAIVDALLAANTNPAHIISTGNVTSALL